MKKTANIVSVIFHPTLLPSWLMCILLFSVSHDLALDKMEKKVTLLTTFFVFTFFLPLMNVFILHRLKYVSSMQMDDRRERTMPYAVGMVYYAGLFYLLNDSDISFFYKALVAAGFVLILFTLLVNLRWKISAHAIGAGGFSGALLIYSLLHRQDIVFWICISFLAGSLSCWARLYLKKHSPSQVYLGYLCGLSLSILSILAAILVFIKIQIN